MFTGPVGPVEVFFTGPKLFFGNFYWPGAIGSPLASSPALFHIMAYLSFQRHFPVGSLTLVLFEMVNESCLHRRRRWNDPWSQLSMPLLDIAISKVYISRDIFLSVAWISIYFHMRQTLCTFQIRTAKTMYALLY